MTIQGVGALRQVVDAIMKDLPSDVNVILLNGDLGAGKTHFAQAFAAHLGIEDSLNSPTFSIVNEYEYACGGQTKVLFHMDLYRLKQLEEALDIGVEEYLYSGQYCLIEWPDIIEPIVPENALSIQIEIEEPDTRTFSWQEQ